MADPRFSLVPPGVSSLGGDAVALSASVGLELDQWQAYFLESAMGVDEEGRWAADDAVLVVPRQNGKSVCLLARALWGAVEGGEELILWTSHEFKTARESFMLLKSLVESPAFIEAYGEPQVSVSHGKEGVTFANGSRILFIARSRTSGRGFSPDFVVWDEAFELDDLALAALKPALAAKDNPAAWFASSAPHATSTVLRRFCLRGRAGEGERLCYVEYCAADDAPSDSVAAWKQANPAIGSRLTLEYTASELEDLDEEDFRRERLGVWSEEQFDSVFDVRHWSDLGVSKAPKVSGLRTVAVDVNPERRTSITAAGELADDRILVEVLDERAGVDWAVEVVASLVEEHSPAAVLVDGAGQSQTLIAPLQRAGVEVRRTNTAEMVAACGQFYDYVADGRLVHMDQADLNAAVEGAVQRAVGDGWAWARRSSKVNVSPLVAASLALFGVVDTEDEPEWEAVWAWS